MAAEQNNLILGEKEQISSIKISLISLIKVNIMLGNPNITHCEDIIINKISRTNKSKYKYIKTR